MENNNNRNTILGAFMASFLLLSLSVEARTLEEVKPNKELLSQKFIDQVKSTEQSNDPQTKKICGKTINPVICEQTVAVSNNESLPITPKNVILFQVTAAMGETILAFKDCKDANPGNEDREGFSYCKGSYEKSGEELGNAINACKVDDMKTMIVLVQGAMKHFETCQQDLEKNDKADSPLKEVNDYLNTLGENSISIANAISDGSIDNRRR